MSYSVIANLVSGHSLQSYKHALTHLKPIQRK